MELQRWSLSPLPCLVNTAPWLQKGTWFLHLAPSGFVVDPGVAH
jgi:hypothetical protein